MVESPSRPFPWIVDTPNTRSNKKTIKKQTKKHSNTRVEGTNKERTINY